MYILTTTSTTLISHNHSLETIEVGYLDGREFNGSMCEGMRMNGLEPPQQLPSNSTAAGRRVCVCVCVYFLFYYENHGK